MTTPPGYADVSVQVRHTLMARPAFFTFGVDPSTADAADVASRIGLSLNASGSLVSRFDNNTTVGPVTVRMGQDGGEALVYVSTVTYTGGSGGSSVPPNVAVLVHKRTTRGGRRGRGRMFLPWWAQIADVDEKGTIAAATQTFMQTCLNTFLTDLNTRAVPMVVLHEPGKPPPAPQPGLPDLVTALYLDPTVATQRRRLGR